MKKITTLFLCICVLNLGTAQIHPPPIHKDMASLGTAVLVGALAGAFVVAISLYPWDHNYQTAPFPNTVNNTAPFWMWNSNLITSASASIPLTVSNVCGHVHFKPSQGPFNPQTTNYVSDYFTCVVQASHNLTNWHSYSFDIWIDPTGGYVLNWGGAVSQGTVATGMILPMPDDIGTNWPATYFRILNP